MAKNNRITANDVLRFPPHIQAQIRKQLEDQGVILQPTGPGGRTAVPKIPLTPTVYLSFGAYFALLGIITLALLATWPTHWYH